MKVYRIYSKIESNKNGKLIARFVISDNQLTHLEVHTANFDKILPEGKVDGTTLYRLQRLKTSAYFNLVCENDIGNWKQLVPSLDVGEISPDHTYQLTDKTGQNLGTMQIYESVVMLNGKKIEDAPKEQLFQKIRNGEINILEQ